MLKKIKCIIIVITLEGIEKIKTEQMTTKQSEQSRERASGLRYILARKMCHNARQSDNKLIIFFRIYVHLIFPGLINDTNLMYPWIKSRLASDVLEPKSSYNSCDCLMYSSLGKAAYDWIGLNEVVLQGTGHSHC